MFFHSLSSLRECSWPCLCRYHPTTQLTPLLMRCHRWLSYSISIGVVVWLFVFTVELAGSYLRHVPCKFWKVCLGVSIFHRSIMEGNWPALDVVHASLITDLFADWACSSCIVGSQQQWYGYSYEKSWWSHRARWRCRYLFVQAVMMVVFAGCNYVDCWTNAHLLSSSRAC